MVDAAALTPKMMDPANVDPRMDPTENPMSFDGNRMIFGGSRRYSNWESDHEQICRWVLLV